jgi:hypothetical protein
MSASESVSPHVCLCESEGVGAQRPHSPLARGQRVGGRKRTVHEPPFGVGARACAVVLWRTHRPRRICCHSFSSAVCAACACRRTIGMYAAVNAWWDRRGQLDRIR